MCSLESVVEYPVDTLGFGGSGRCVARMENVRRRSQKYDTSSEAPALVYPIWRWLSSTSSSRNMENVFAIAVNILS